MTNRPLAVMAAVLAIGAAGCSSTPSDDENVSSPEMGHIHALQINPADQNLYAATHHGVFVISDGDEPQLVGDLVQDFMGFAVAGPDHFLASGHPGAGQPGPADLGLIESTDGGQSWTALSLSGRVDFHALDYRHGRVYGLDSHTGQILVSDDKQTWQARPPVEAIDLAVSPNDADEFLITTADGLQRSRDGGDTYEPVAAAPTLAYLSWPDSGPLIGVDPAGTLYASADAGVTWQARHGLGQRPQAVLAMGDGRVFVATDTAVYRSTDNGVAVTELTGLH